MDDLETRRLRRTLTPTAVTAAPIAATGVSAAPAATTAATGVTAAAPAPVVCGPWTACTLSLDLDGTILAAGNGAREVLGWAPEDLPGSHVRGLVPQLAAELGERHLDALLADGEVAMLVEEGLARDGRAFTASISLGAERNPAGELTGVTAVVRDVSAELRRGTGERAGERSGERAGEQAVVVTDADLSIAYAARAASQLLGYEPEELLARGVLQLVHVADQPVVTAAVDRALADPDRDERFLARIHDKARRWRWVEGTVTNLLDDPDVLGLVVALRDVTDRVRSREALRLSRALHRARVEAAEEGIVVAGEDGVARYANAAASRLLGIPAEQLYGIDLDGLLDQPPAGGPVPVPRAHGEVSPREIGYAHPDGTHRIFEVTRDALGDDEPDGAGWLVTVADVTERRRSERALRHRALYDQLTGLPNRYLLRDRLEMAAARQQRAGGHGTAVIFLDLDRFKAVNDTRGHAAGDQLLRQVASRLGAVVRATDTVCRLGGDEFVVVCEDIDGPGAESVVERVRTALRRPYDVAGGPVEVGASIGVALSPPHPLDELVHLADLAMYRAKHRDGDRTAPAGPDDQR